VKLSDSLNLHIVANSNETSADGERDDNLDKLRRKDAIILDLKVELQTAKHSVNSLKREIKILRDCKMKNGMQFQQNNNKQIKKNKRSVVSFLLGGFAKLIGFVVFVCIMVLFYDWIVTMQQENTHGPMKGFMKSIEL